MSMDRIRRLGVSIIDSPSKSLVQKTRELQGLKRVVESETELVPAQGPFGGRIAGITQNRVSTGGLFGTDIRPGEAAVSLVLGRVQSKIFVGGRFLEIPGIRERVNYNLFPTVLSVGVDAFSMRCLPVSFAANLLFQLDPRYLASVARILGREYDVIVSQDVESIMRVALGGFTEEQLLSPGFILGFKQTINRLFAERLHFLNIISVNPQTPQVSPKFLAYAEKMAGLEFEARAIGLEGAIAQRRAEIAAGVRVTGATAAATEAELMASNPILRGRKIDKSAWADSAEQIAQVLVDALATILNSRR